MKKNKIKILFCSFAAFLLSTMPVLADVKLTNPLKSDNPAELIGFFIRGIMGLVGSIALVMFIIGGLMWLTSGGNPDKIKKGRDIILWSIIGLIIIFASYTLVDFVISTVAK